MIINNAMTYYCVNCWHEIKKDVLTCPYCGFDLKQASENSFTDKLIKALNHPEPETPIRAANILGELKVKKALDPLLLRLQHEKDPFIIEAVVNAILKIDPDQLSEIKKIIGDNLPITVKKILEM